ncbi:MAG: xylulokinase [Lachnospiraceae bacterium]|nr:xylulokinase [Lachnospiraceae bacterium]
MNYLIGIDVGTSSTKAILIDENGKVMLTESEKYPMYQPHNGWAEQKPEDWKKAAFTVIKRLVKNSKLKSSDIKAIGLTGQMHGLVMLDEKGSVLMPSIIWCDQRTEKEVDEMLDVFPKKKWINITANPPLTGWTLAKILWVRNNRPEIYEKCRHILLPKDYIRYELTGVFATDVSDASGMQLMDIRRRDWSDEILNRFKIDEKMLGKMHESFEVTGSLKADIAKELGLSKDTLVVAGAGDNAAAAVGLGVVKKNRGFISIGTSGVVFVHTDNPIVDMGGRVHTCCHAVPGAWHVMGVTQAAGQSLKWLRKEIISLGDYDLMNEYVEEIPVGADKLIYLPYLMGERTPHLDPNLRGVFFGLSGIHSKKHMLRAAMEGVAYSFRDCKEVLSQMGINTDEMLICGGGAKNNIWCEIVADNYKSILKKPESEEGPAMGAAILAGVGSGVFESLENACERIVKIKEEISYNKDNAVIYDDYYKLYKKLHDDLKEDFDFLAGL